jgi:hypothetical protein
MTSDYMPGMYELDEQVVCRRRPKGRHPMALERWARLAAIARRRTAMPEIDGQKMSAMRPVSC